MVMSAKTQARKPALVPLYKTDNTDPTKQFVLADNVSDSAGTKCPASSKVPRQNGPNMPVNVETVPATVARCIWVPAHAKHSYFERRGR